MTTPTPKQLRQIAEAATPGPWWKGSWSGQCHMPHMHGRGSCKYEYTRKDSDCVSTEMENQTLIGYNDYGPVLAERDAQFIATFNPATVLGMLDRIDKFRTAIEYLSLNRFQLTDQRIYDICKEALCGEGDV